MTYAFDVHDRVERVTRVIEIELDVVRSFRGCVLDPEWSEPFSMKLAGTCTLGGQV